jgi:hypothetical protein
MFIFLEEARVLEDKMNEQNIPTCSHCGVEMKRWRTPANSTWQTEFLWVCFNDTCPYFVRGWDHMMNTQNVKASYRYSLNPEKGTSAPLPCWSHDAHKDHIIE